MKRTLTYLLALFMVLSLAACGAKNNGTPSSMTEVASLEELSEKANCALIRPEDTALTNEAYYLIDGEPQIAEYRFKVNGTECFLRFAAADIATDICGIYNENGTLFADSDSENHYIENDELKIHRWFTVDGQYVFAALDNSEMDWTEFDSICTQFAKMEPRNWTADVPFATYQAMEGSYQNEANDVYGAIAIRGDHVGLYVLADQEDGSRLYWEMEAVLKGDQLVYEKETISQIVYDETEGCTKTTELPDGGAGSVEVRDGTLIFVNAYSQQLKDLVLVAAEQ